MHSSEKAIRTRAMLVLGNPFILGVIQAISINKQASRPGKVTKGEESP